MYFLTIFSIITFFKFFNVYCEINMTIYRKLPPLHEFDNFDHCLSESSSTYCMVFSQIESNNDSNIWRYIEEYSKDSYHHFRHDILFFGVCIEQCNELLNQFIPLELKKFSENKTLQNEITDYYRKIHTRNDAYYNRLHFENLVASCVNYRFQQKYNLSILTSIEYCENSGNTLKLDSIDIIFYVIILSLIFLSIISSLYDYHLKSQQDFNLRNNDFYKKPFKNKGSALLRSFSVCRNYYRITSEPPNQNSSDIDLKFTYAFRVFTLFIVILGHCIMLHMSIQIQNPEFFEEFYYHIETIIFQNGSAMIQIFFLLAGFFLKLKFDLYKMITPKSSYKTGILVYIQCFLHRYLRLLPSLAMVLLFNASLFIRLESGPFWRHASEAEYTFCREYWWKNVFMINNFMLKDSCAQHTWYLAADMQLFELFLFIIIISSKFNFLKNPCYILMGICAMVVPGVLTYFYKLDAIHNLKPEGYRYLYFKDVDTFYITYPQFYCNIGGYLVGLICAEIYLKYIKNSKYNKDKFSKYRGVIKYELVLLVLIVGITAGLLLSGNLVVNKDIKKPSIWLALYASLYRNMWAIFGGFILLCMMLKFGWIAYEIACLSIFRLLGKISFQSYLWHVPVLRILGGFYRQPIYVNEFYMIIQIILGFVLTNIVAFFMALFVEYPIGELVRYLLRSRITKTHDIEDTNDDNENEMKPHIKEIGH